MQGITFIGLLVGASAGTIQIHSTLRHSMLRVNVSQTGPGARFGNEDCPCVGIDGLEGKTEATLSDGSKANYPADLGGRCTAWDKDHHKDCPGKDFCEKEWCYVDPCNCKNVGVLPKPSVYLPGAKYHGRPVHYSYATCGSKDEYTGKVDDNRQTYVKDIQQTCSVTPDASEWGEENCRCIGVGPQPGVTKVNIDGKMVDFPADVGATCKSWETGNHPECGGANAPSWCTAKWCFVDPCSCTTASPPKTSTYLPTSKYQGKPIYYNYETCKGVDSFTGDRKEACVNMKKKEDCAKLDKCAWSPDKKCLGKELIEVCHSGAAQFTYILALALPLLALIH